MGKVVRLLSQSYLPNQGRYPRITKQAKSLIEDGYKVLVLGWDRIGNCSESETVDGIEVKRVKVKSKEMRGPIQILFLTQFWIKAFLKLLNEKIDIVHCHNLDVMPLGYIVSKVKGCKFIYDAHEPDYYTLWPKKWHFLLNFINWLEFFLARRSDAVIVTNSYQVEKFNRKGIKKIRVISNYPSQDAIIDKPRNSTENRGVVFGRIGTIYPNIGLEEVCLAMKDIVKKYPDTKLFFAGRVVDSYEPRFKEILKTLDGYAEYVGSYRAEEMQTLYRKIDVSLLVYRRNAWFSNITPAKFYDSLANGVPIIMTDIGNLGSVIERNRCGIVVDDTDIASVIEAMERMIRNPELRKEMAENSLRLAKNEYNWDKMARELKDLYASL